MSRNLKIIVLSLIFILSIYNKYSSSDDNKDQDKKELVVKTPTSLNKLVELADKSNNNINQLSND